MLDPDKDHAVSAAAPRNECGAALLPRAQPLFVVPMIVAIAFLMESIDQTIITASIPAMALSLEVKPLSLNLAITSYLLSLAVFIPVSGWVADRYGARRVFLSAILLFMFGSVLCGAAGSLGLLVSARILQGLGGALMTPVGRLILLRAVPAADLVTAIAYMTTPVVIAPLVGPVLGGVITTYLGWRWIFLLNVPIGLLGILLTLRYIRAQPGGAGRPFDLPGFLLCAVALVAMQVLIENAIHGFLPVGSNVFLAAAIALPAMVYVHHARRVASPVLDIALFRTTSFRVGALAGGVSRVGLNGIPFLLQLQMQIGMGYTPVHSGLIVFVTAIGSLITKPFLKPLVAMFGFRRLLSVNALPVAAMAAGLGLYRPSWPVGAIIAYLLLFGCVRSIQFNVINSLIYGGLSPGQHSDAVSLGGVTQQVFMGLGISVGAMTTSWLSHGVAHPSMQAFAAAFPISSAIILAGGAGFLLLPAGHRAMPKAIDDDEPLR